MSAIGAILALAGAGLNMLSTGLENKENKEQLQASRRYQEQSDKLLREHREKMARRSAMERLLKPKSSTVIDDPVIERKYFDPDLRGAQWASGIGDLMQGLGSYYVSKPTPSTNTGGKMYYPKVNAMEGGFA